MKTNIKKTVAVVTLVLGSSVFAVNSHAALVGVIASGGVNNEGVTQSVSDLSGAVTLTVIDQKVSVVGNTVDLGPFNSAAAIDRLILSGSLVINVLAGVGPGSIASFSAFDIASGGNTTFGGFTASSAVVVGPRSTNFLDIFVTGTYNPDTSGTALVGSQIGGCNDGTNTCNVTSASMRWSFNRSGDTVTGSSTFNSPALTLNVPEPVSLSLLGMGLVGWAASRRKSSLKAA